MAMLCSIPVFLIGSVPAAGSMAAATRPGKSEFRFGLCSERAFRLEGPPGAQQSRGCVVTFTQELTDDKTRARLGVGQLERRYLVYVPKDLASAGLSSPPAPVVF